MPDSNPSDQRQRAVLAAVLAVKRGFLSPEEAMGILEQVEEPAGAKAGATLLSLGSGEGRSGDASSLILARATPGARSEIAQEIELLVQDPGKAAETLGFGDAATRLASKDAVKQTLLAVAATGPIDRKHASSRLAAVQKGAERYEIKRELARGGMGRVLIALDNAVGREVALKELLPQNNGTTVSQRLTGAGELADRFLREAKVTGQLEHPNIIPVYEIGARDNGSVFYTMKLIRGTTLAERIRQITHDASLGEAAKFNARLKLLEPFVDVCNALAYAHARGVIHRDIKPANVMLGDFGETLVLDWGLARVKGQADEAARRARQDTPDFSPSLVGTESESRTLDGSVIGTPAYMAPEQAMGELSEVDEKSDVYSLGATLFEIVAGCPPYEGKTANQILGKVQNVAPAALPAWAPADLRALVERAMARDKSERLPSAQALGEEVRAFREGRPLSVYRYTRREKARKFVARNKLASLVAALALVAIIAVASVAFLRVVEERNEARDALARAEAAEQSRLALEAEKASRRQALIDRRKKDIARQRALVDGLRHKELLEAATKQLKAMAQRPAASAALALEQAETRDRVAALLNHARELRTLHDLCVDPVDGAVHAFAAEDEVQQWFVAHDSLQRVAIELATANEDFALADFIIDRFSGVVAPGEVERMHQTVDNARHAQRRRHAELIAASLARLRADRARVASQTDEFNEMVARISALRERQTVELLEAALKPHTLKASTPDSMRLWTQPEREEITLVCRVFSRMEMPELCVPPLSEFLAVIDDERLATEAAIALCLTEAWQAEEPVLKAARRFERRPMFWNSVGRFFTRLPDPPSRPEPKTAAEFVERGHRHLLKGKGKEARADFTKALELEPDNAQIYLERGQISGTGEDADLEDMRQALKLNPGLGRAWVRIAYILRTRNDLKGALDAATQGTLVEPGEATTWAARGNLLGQMGQYRDSIADYTRAIEIDPYRVTYLNNRAIAFISVREYERAIVDCTRALDLDPYFQEGWANRSTARLALGDTEGALADATRIIELAPRYSWGYSARGQARLTRRDFVGAEYDFARAVEFAPWAHQFWLHHARALRALKRFDDALAVCRRCLKEQPVSSVFAETLASFMALVELQKRGSTDTGATQAVGFKALCNCIALLGELDITPDSGDELVRQALICLGRGAAADSDDKEAHRRALVLCLESIMPPLQERELRMELAEILTTPACLEAVQSPFTAYNAACVTATAAACFERREFVILGASAEDAARKREQLLALSEEERGQRAAALKDSAFAWLNRALALGFKESAHTAEDPDLACLRDDPRFAELLARMK